MQTVTAPYASALVDWAADVPEALVLSGDLTGSTEISPFKRAFPERFFSLGMAEQNMMSFAGGLAREGFVPFVHTFAVFMYRRALDQIEMSITYPNLRVRMMGFLPGIMTPGGVSHQAINDVAVLRSLPNLTIVESGDATDLETMLPVLHEIDGPVYVRVLRKAVPRLFPRTEPFRLDRVRVLSTGTDLSLFTAGASTAEALKAVGPLRKRGVTIEHVHVSTHKPFTDPQIAESLAKAPHCVTMENHSVINGLGSGVAETLAEHGLGARLHRIGLQDTYAFGATEPYLKRVHGLDARALVERVEKVLDTRFGIGDDELDAADATIGAHDAVGADQLEAL